MIQKGHIKKDTINFDQKSNLAKLLATENITVQHDQVKTASFNLEDRILTIPIFKNPKGAVYDMLVGHEVSHALHTPQKDWIDALKKDDLMKIKDYINVIEDVRIDKMIQKKYPGLVNDYRDGFHILWNDNFFGCKDKDLNKELMLIDKINLHFKSSKTLDIKFSNADKLFVNLVDKCKTFKDVIEAAKKLAEWQKKENEKLEKLPDFDSHPLTLSYGEKPKEEENQDDNEGSSPSDKSDDEKSDIEKAIEEANAIKKEAEGKKDSEDNEKSGSADKDTKADGDKKELESTSRKNQTGNPDGAGGKNVRINMPLKSITQNASEEKISKNYIDKQHRGYSYMNIPDCNLDKIIYPMDKWVKTGMSAAKKNGTKDTFVKNWDDYKKFKKESERTITYLVKEFEMKKSAEGYKRQTQDKTGIIDPLKLHQYKTSEDIFKRLSIIPDAKNHGMILLLDWSGSMANVIGKTVEQLLQLVWFCQRINIPYKVYFFSDKIADASWSDRREIAKKEMMTNWNFKAGDMIVEAFQMIEVASNNAKKQKLDQSLFLLYSYSKYYDDNYNWRSQTDYIERLYPPYEFQLSSTPLNESLAAMYKIVPMFKQKYQVDKLSLITLTDGHSNNSNVAKWLTKDGKLDKSDSDWGSIPILKLGSKYLKAPGNEYDRSGTTGLLLEGLKRKFNMTTIGFYLLKRTQRYEFERYALSGKQRNLPYSLREELLTKKKAEFNKNKSCSVKSDGYSDFFLINAKTMKVENTNLNELKETSKKGDIKRIFGKSMKSRTISRILLSKFIKRVA